MFRRFSKRRKARALIVALIDRVEWGGPSFLQPPIAAREFGICTACSGEINIGDQIALARVGPASNNTQTFVHWQCPGFWSLFSDTLEVYDNSVISKINKFGRGNASGCGHDVTGKPVYLVRKPQSLVFDRHSDWFCEDCVTQGSQEV